MARHLCAELGFDPGDVLTGSQLAAISPEALIGGLNETRLFCRVTPQQKLRVILALKRRGLQAELSEETLDGAAVYGLSNLDRPLVSAFMAGVHRTAKLKFDHPALATTATRSGSRLIIQKDIGATDAHVIVVHVEGLTVSVTYTDVHPERLTFFKEMLQSRAVTWEKKVPPCWQKASAVIHSRASERSI